MKTEDLVFGLMATFGESGLPPSALISLATPLGVSATNVRSHLSRLCSKGLLKRVSETEPRYELGRRGSRISRLVTSKLQIDEQAPWDNSWFLAAFAFKSADATAKARLRKKLDWLGFIQRQPGLYLRPNWPAWDWPALIRDSATDCLCETFHGEWCSPPPTPLEHLWKGIDDFSGNVEALTEDLRGFLANKSVSDARTWHLIHFQCGNRFYPLIAEDRLLPIRLYSRRQKLVELKSIWREFSETARQRSSPFTESIIRRFL